LKALDSSDPKKLPAVVKVIKQKHTFANLCTNEEDGSFCLNEIWGAKQYGKGILIATAPALDAGVAIQDQDYLSARIVYLQSKGGTVYFSTLPFLLPSSSELKFYGKLYKGSTVASFYSDVGKALERGKFNNKAVQATYAKALSGLSKIDFSQVSKGFLKSTDSSSLTSFSDGSSNPVNDYAYSADGKVYYVSNGGWKTEIPGADYASFKTFPPIFGGVYNAKDKNHVYDGGEILAWADPATFEIPSKSIMKDKNHVFVGATEITGADPATIQELDMTYFKDKNHAYYVDTARGSVSQIIPGADVATFTVGTYNSGYASDKNATYYKGVKTAGSASQYFGNATGK
jgi:hypothetical protein